MQENPSGQRYENSAAVQFKPSGKEALPHVFATVEQQDANPPPLVEVLQNWERIGGPRRDGERHHAGMLQMGARIAIVAGALSFFFFPSGLIGLVVGWITWRKACYDLDRISMGFMDQDGFHVTERARAGSCDGMALCACALFLWSIIFGYIYAILRLLTF
jgi:hypothetical protein